MSRLLLVQLAEYGRSKFIICEEKKGRFVFNHKRKEVGIGFFFFDISFVVAIKFSIQFIR